jgi:hypothetical protein
VAGEEGQMNREPRKESVLTRFTGFLRGAGSTQGPDVTGVQEPVVIFKDPVAELPEAGAPPPPVPGTIIPLREREGQCAGEPGASSQEKKEKPPETPPET